MSRRSFLSEIHLRSVIRRPSHTVDFIRRQADHAHDRNLNSPFWEFLCIGRFRIHLWSELGYQIPPGTLVIRNQVTWNQMHTPSPAEFVPDRFQSPLLLGDSALAEDCTWICCWSICWRSSGLNMTTSMKDIFAVFWPFHAHLIFFLLFK